MKINENVIRAAFPMPARIQELVTGARADLYHGPMSAEALDLPSWPGFCTACDEIQKWAADTLEDIWYEYDSDDICFSEPAPYQDEENEDDEDDLADFQHDYTALDVEDLKVVLFGKELAKYL